MEIDDLINQIANTPAPQAKTSKPQTYGAAKQDEYAREVLERLEALGELPTSGQSELERLRAGAGQSQETIGATNATYRGALQGATFQHADELYGLFGGDKDAARSRNRQAQEAYPRAYNTGLLGGAVASGLATAPIAAGGATLLGAAARGGLLGGLEGAAWGAGGGEGVADKARGAATDGAIGAGLGLAAPLAVSGATKGATALADVFGGVLNRGNQRRAERAVMGALRRSGKTLDGVSNDLARAAVQGQPEYRLMDALGMPGQRQASGVVRGGGDGAEELAAYLNQRQLDQPDRIASFIDDGFGTKGTTAQRTQKAMKAERKRVATEAYGAVRDDAGPVDVRGALALIDDRIGGMKGSNIAGDSIDARLARFRNRLAANPAPGGEISRELSDISRVMGVKQDVQDAAGLALRQGRNNEARELSMLYKELDKALEAASGSYRAANDGYSAASKAIEAIDDGASMATKGRGIDNVSQFRQMSADQQAAARIGYGDSLLEKIERGASPTANRAKALSTSKAKTESAAMSIDPELLASRIARENDMWSTQNRALGGSRTADNLQDMTDTGAALGLLRAGRDLIWTFKTN